MAKSKTKKNKQNQSRGKKHDSTIAMIAGMFFIVIMAIYPLYMNSARYIGLTWVKTSFFWTMTGIAGAAVLFMFICVKRSWVKDYYAENEPARKISIAEWALLGFIVWTFISAFLAHWLRGHGSIVWLGYVDVMQHAERYEGFISFFAYAMCFIIIARLYKYKQWHLAAVAISAIIVSLIGVLQFFGHDIFNLFPFTGAIQTVDAHGNPIFGPLSAFFRTTLGNVNIVSAYCSFMILLFTGLFAVSSSLPSSDEANKRITFDKISPYLYLAAGMFSFALSLTTGLSGDAHTVAVLGAMILLIPYWISDRGRLGRVLIMLASWCLLYAGYNAYVTAMQRRFEAGEHFPPADAVLLSTHTPTNTVLFLIVAAVLLICGFLLILVLKKWVAPKVAKIAGAVFLGILIAGGIAGLEIVGSRLSDQPDNIIWQAREMMHGRIDDSFGSNRGWIWRNAIEVIPYNPIFGTGPDTFYHALGPQRQAEAVAHSGETYDKAHNIFLQIAVCMGIPALIAYLIFLGGVFIPSVKRAFDRPLLFAFGAAALAYVIQSFFAVEVPITTPLLWIALGVMASEVWIVKIGEKSNIVQQTQ